MLTLTYPGDWLTVAPNAQTVKRHFSALCKPNEWLTSVLICDGCGVEYDQDRDECPGCGAIEAELVDTGGGPGRFWG